MQSPPLLGQIQDKRPVKAFRITEMGCSKCLQNKGLPGASCIKDVLAQIDLRWYHDNVMYWFECCLSQYTHIQYRILNPAQGEVKTTL